VLANASPIQRTTITTQNKHRLVYAGETECNFLPAKMIWRYLAENIMTKSATHKATPAETKIVKADPKLAGIGRQGKTYMKV
jgi:hypothetical protein